QFLLRDHFDWHYMSIAGAFSIIAGTWFARAFLQSRKHLPRFDYALIVMLVNAAVLVFAAVAGLTTLAVLSITLALLMYPLIVVAALLRWRQGSQEALVFAAGWAALVVALFAQALRDLGFLPHDGVNYYGPLLGSFIEMIVILFALGMTLKRLEIARSAAEQEALIDPLTRTKNRRSFFRLAGSALDRSRDRGAPISLLMLDLDHFKAINDTHGHPVGDQALQAFAAAVEQQIRDDDVFARVGGEEFALMMVGSPKAVEQTAERLRRVISKLSILTGDKEIGFTVSIGVAHYSDEADIEALLQHADRALYDAKQAGRDQVVVFAG
ncbi:MAG: diguanylate cyclase, partial [Pseudomonadota bacterium]